MDSLRELNRHMVDLRRSKWDKERSKPDKGIYFFEPNGKVYLRFDDYKDSATRPNFAYRWVAYHKHDDFKSMRTWAFKWGAEPVKASDPLTEVWPESLAPDTEGNYHYEDLILMRIPTERWADKLETDAKYYDDARTNLDKKFRAEARAENAEVIDSITRF